MLKPQGKGLGIRRTGFGAMTALAMVFAVSSQALFGLTEEQLRTMSNDAIVAWAKKAKPDEIAQTILVMPEDKLRQLAMRLPPERLKELQEKCPPSIKAKLASVFSTTTTNVIGKKAGLVQRVAKDAPVKIVFTLDKEKSTAEVFTVASSAARDSKLAAEDPTGENVFYFDRLGNEKWLSKYVPGTMELVFIPAEGKSFRMGSLQSEPGRMCDEDIHEVTLPESFWMGCFEVTCEQWNAIMGADDVNKGGHKLPIGVPAWGDASTGKLYTNFPPKALKWSKKEFINSGYPVVNVSYEDAQRFCTQLTLYFHKYLKDVLKKDKRMNAIMGQYTDIQFMLPNEAQWEYACRAEKMSAFFSGKQLLSRDANFCAFLGKEKKTVKVEKKKEGDNGQPHDGQPGDGNEKKEIVTKTVVKEYSCRMKPVGSCNANDFGLYDMHGNVWEWCRGGYYGYPTFNKTGTASKVDLVGNPRANTFVARGGGWYSLPDDCRCARRMDMPRDARQDNIGFRVILVGKRKK